MKLQPYYRKFAELVIDYPKIVIAIIGVITVLFAFAAMGIKIDPDPWKMIPEEDPAVVYWLEVEDLFGKSDAVIVAVNAPDTVYNPQTLKKVDELTRRLEDLTLITPQDERTIVSLIGKTDGEVKDLLTQAVDGGLTRADYGAVSEALRLLKSNPDADPAIVWEVEDLSIALDPLDKVKSLSTIENIQTIDGSLSTDVVMNTVPTTNEGCRLVRERVLGNDMLSGKIVSRDEKGTIVFSDISYDGHDSRTVALCEKVQGIVKDMGGPEKYYVSGTPIIMSRDSTYMRDDMSFLIPLVILVIMASLYIVFRNVRGMLQPMLVVLTSVVWTIGLMALLKVSISIVSSAMPVILIAMGCAYGIHITTQFYGRLSVGVEKRQAILDTMEEITSPVIMTAVTSMVGYGSLLTSNLSPIKEFGIFTTFGIFVAVLVSLTLIPAMFILLKTPTKHSAAVDRSSESSPIVRILDGLGKVVIRKKLLVLAVLVPLFVFIVVMALQVTVGYGFINDFKRSSDIRISDEKINEKFPGTITFNIVIDSGRPDGAKDPEFLKKVQNLCRYLETDPVVGGSTTMVDFISRMNYVMHDNDPSYRRLPNEVEEVTVVPEGGGEPVVERVKGSDLVAQYILLYENSGGQDISSVVDFEYRKVNVVVFLKSSYSGDITSVEEKAISYIKKNFTNGAEAHATGSGDLIVVISRYIIVSQLWNLVTSLLTVLVMLMVVFRSVKAGLFAITPIIFTIFVNFALMRLVGVHLDVATAMIASMGLGDWIDFSIYFISIYRLELEKGLGREDTLAATLHNTGRPIFFNAVSVAAGFIVLMLSNFKPIINIGWLVAATMLISAFATIVILPMLISRFGLFKNE